MLQLMVQKGKEYIGSDDTQSSPCNAKYIVEIVEGTQAVIRAGQVHNKRTYKQLVEADISKSRATFDSTQPNVSITEEQVNEWIEGPLVQLLLPHNL